MNYQLSEASIWILAKYLELQKDLENHLQNYELAHSIDGLYKFLWDDFANWYVEYLKTDKSQIPFAKELFRQYIITLSPYAPFETEALWQQFFDEKNLLAFETKDPNWSTEIVKTIDLKSAQNFESIIELISDLRSFRGLFAIDPVNFIDVVTENSDFSNYHEFIKLVGRAEITTGNIEGLYVIQSSKFSLGINLLDYIKDIPAEINRTDKIIISLQKQIQALENQLANQKFLENAEPEIVSQKQQDLEDRKLEKQQQQAKLLILK